MRFGGVLLGMPLGGTHRVLSEQCIWIGNVGHSIRVDAANALRKVVCLGMILINYMVLAPIGNKYR
jgi:hypothetical protein